MVAWCTFCQERESDGELAIEVAPEQFVELPVCEGCLQHPTMIRNFLLEHLDKPQGLVLE